MEAVMAGHTSRAPSDTAYRHTQPARRGVHTLAIDPLVARRIARLSFVVLLTAAAIVVMITRAYQPERPAPAAWSSVTVAEGSSLWDLATANPVSGLSTPETIVLIRDANGLCSSTLKVGQVLRVPAANGPDLSVAAR